MNGVKRAGCALPNCEPCALVRARAKAFGPANVFVAVTPAELRILRRTPALAALAARVEHAAVFCANTARRTA